jgi:H+/Cl- antiporter ClcA
VSEVILAVCVGVLSALCSSLFLHLLQFVTELRSSYPIFIFGLPFYGLLFAYVIKHIPHYINQGVPYLVHEIENPQAKVSVWMTPFILISAVLTHLFGGSAGREGVGVIMGASIAQILPKFSKYFENRRQTLVCAGVAAGVSSIFGTPIAGIFFAYEIYHFRYLKNHYVARATIIAAIVAYVLGHFLGPQHDQFIVNFEWNADLMKYLAVATFTSGIGGLIFFWGMHYYTKIISFIFRDLYQKLFFGSCLIVLLVFITDSYRYTGIGSDVIAQSFTTSMSFTDFFMKCLLTIMTISIGFKAGEVTPLFFMGATLSNATASMLGLANFGLSSALGMVSIFGAVSATPIASAVMSAELFGPHVGILCLIVCLISRKFLFNKSIYRH